MERVLILGPTTRSGRPRITTSSRSRERPIFEAQVAHSSHSRQDHALHLPTRERLPKRVETSSSQVNTVASHPQIGHAASYIGVPTDDKLSRRLNTSVTLPAQLKEKDGESLLIGSKAVRQSGVWSLSNLCVGLLGTSSCQQHRQSVI